MHEADPNGQLDRNELGRETREEHREVTLHPDRGSHSRTGGGLAGIVEYRDEWLDGVPEEVVASFAGIRNPLEVGAL